ncbi:MAG: alanine--tRNA ligase-related protein, partial [Patescibacteria group bacterium]
KEEGLGLDPSRLYVTTFAGDENAPEDIESPKIWQKLGVPRSRIYPFGAEDNLWSPGDNGPCGPDSEMFYDVTSEGLGDLSKEEFLNAVKQEDLVEIWNDVFMEYEKKDGRVVGKLTNRNVDTGAGLERMTAVVQKKKTAYETDLFIPIMLKIDEFSAVDDPRARRIVADHIRTAVFMIGDGVLPANTDRGYVLRRLLRRAVRYADTLQMKHGSLLHLAGTVIDTYQNAYQNLKEQRAHIEKEVEKEESKFRETLERGLKEFEKVEVNSVVAFDLFQTYGFPYELTEELAKEKGIVIDKADFDRRMKEHQALSRSSSEQKFKGGLADHSEETVRLHTAHHLLLGALQEVMGASVKQRGSNITSERLRIDFSFERKMTDDEKKQTEDLVNKWIAEAIPVVRRDMPKAEAEALGAEHEFGATYGDIVSVYFVERTDGTRVSKEFCGGPHVSSTSELGVFKIQKEEAVASGIRRIKATLK